MSSFNVLVFVLTNLCIQLCKSELSLLTKKENDGKYTLNCIATGKDISSTITWWNKSEPAAVSVNRKIKSLHFLESRKWIYDSSFSRDLEPIVDERWEEFDTIKLSAHKPHIIENNGKNITHLSLSLFIKNEIKIQFENLLQNITCGADNIIKCNEWNHMNIYVKNANLITIWKENRYLWQLPTTGPINKVQLSTEAAEAYFKIHNYTILITKETMRALPLANFTHSGGQLCLNIFFSMCPNCSMGFILRYDTNSIQKDPIFRRNITNSKQHRAWIKMSMNVETDGKQSSKLLIDSWTNVVGDTKTLGKFWAIHKISTCKQEFRVSSIDATKKDLKNLWCSNLEKKVLIKNNLRKTEESCSAGVFGNSCNISCSNHTPDNTCDEFKICNNKQGCFCSWGYNGSDCKNKCSSQTWGINCENKCGHCKNEVCDTVTGKCNECSTGYISQYCNIRSVPNVTLHVTKSFNWISIESNKYENQSIWKLKYQYNTGDEDKQCDLSRTEHGGFKCNITNLKPGQRYHIEAVMQFNMSKVLVREIDVETKCEENYTLFADIKNSSIKINENEKSAFVTISNISQSCPITNYTSKLWKGSELVKILNVEKMFCEVDNLLPCTKYNITFQNKNNTGENVTKTFQTKSSGKFNNYTSSSEQTGYTAHWIPECTSDNSSKDYNISLQDNGNLFCNSTNTKHITSEVIINGTFLEIKCLKPNRNYTITINYKRSSVLEKLFFTKEGELTNKELPQDVQGNNNFINIKQSKCENFNGPVTYILNFTCKENWCNDTVTKNISLQHYNQTVLTLEVPTNLHPFSEYKVTTAVQRGNSFIKHGQNVSFRSKPAAPPKVREPIIYSKNGSHIWLRWKIPFPPNGKLLSYKICHDPKEDCIKIPLPHCTLWPEYICHILQSLKKETKYTIKISAKNNNTDYGATEELTGFTREEAPDAPVNLDIKMNETDAIVNWDLPVKINGPIKTFQIQLEVLQSETNAANITRNSTIDRNKIGQKYKVTCNFSTRYKISVRLFNEFPGVPNFTYISIPPPKPTFTEDPKFSICNNTICNVTIPPIRNASKNCTLFFMIYNLSGQNPFPNELLEIKEISDYLQQSSNKNISVVKRITILPNSGKFDISINDKNYSSTPHYSDSRFCAIIINEFNGTYAAYIKNVSYLPLSNQRKMGEESISTSSLTLTTLSISVSLLLTGILIYFWIKRGWQVKWWRKIYNRTATNDTCNVELNESLYANVENKVSRPIHIEEYVSYLKKCFENNNEMIIKQYKEIPSEIIHSTEHSNKPMNKTKNRYLNLRAYDHSRVILENLESGYINANYIHGFKSKNAYIATQGPKDNTVDDFWYMVLQNNVQYIIMLCNEMEKRQKKCARYWPSENNSMIVSDFYITNVKTTTHAHYVYRELKIEVNNSEKLVKHLHFTDWPDHGVPLYPRTLIPFMKEMHQIPKCAHPIVVHCSAGVGRTGTIILCDIAIKMAKRTKKLDFMKILFDMREQRFGLVSSSEQYIFAHQLIYEFFFGHTFSIPTDHNFSKIVEEALRNHISKQVLKYINDTAWQYKQHSLSKPLSDEVKIKNRFQHILPGHSRVHFPHSDNDASSTYINAIYVDCFYSEKKFIVTQQPLRHTIGDFWRLIVENDINIIINLNEIDLGDKTSCIFWPTNDIEISPDQYTSVSCKECENKDKYKIFQLAVSSSEPEQTSRIVQFISVSNWKHNNLVPNDLDTLVTLHEKTFNSSRSHEIPIVVTCYDGATASGLFVSLAFIIENLKSEQTLDVPLAISTVRKAREEFVTNEEQIDFLYQSASEYLKSFATYSNFN